MQMTRQLQGETATDWMERAGIAGSFACMAHCLLLPLLVAALPTLSTTLPVPEFFHLWVLLVAIPAAAFALIQGRARHGAYRPLVIGSSGLVLLVIGALLMDESHWEIAATVTGSLLLASAHILNWRLRRACCR